MLASLFKRKSTRQRTAKLLDESFFNSLRKTEYSRLDHHKHIYLDYTGGNLYAASQLDAHHKILKEHTFGNPHSTNPTSMHATQLVEGARQRVLDYFNAKDYHCIFTQNASGALKIVGECYPFQPGSEYLLFADNHNSVNGIREYCKSKGGNYRYVPMQIEDLRVENEFLEEALSIPYTGSNRLFAYPAQSNVSGVQHDLAWVSKAQQKGWDVLLDAAAFVPSSRLDLQEVQPDFVSISFYKIFGYPTGLGCLLVKKSKFNKLCKPWFAGGTVTLASVKSPHHFLAGNHERFENGTLNYLDIPALKIGLDHIDSIGIERINTRVNSLTRYLFENLNALKHCDGSPKVRIFGPADRKQTGGTLIMNFYDERGRTLPFEEVEQKANACNISLRTGCFCNPGIDEINNDLSSEELGEFFSSNLHGGYREIINALQKMRGAIRISVGIATTKYDLDYFIAFAKKLS
ncbi:MULTISPECIES: aminotransferase class V-fold PLP-dependent enzyme [unclassified Leeuwenhoekiella]|uniref:aminotransferase class V-fold PLP-dependent enzyme n=1 Tax=unclassified Leeuwenhoekiella TaxID=2615029 RepID=UPI000C64800A|nr:MULTISPECIES: aminotransferase class V-fold PLP-dependent enzyme [unclassified Leeuwenhoekiella]MBA80164.1 cysteine desulfurase [Leeuwenhoekiella sp.]|tara:strand:+ start:7419 stop:8804 length:1386 start_codon:yes stop_codon:yes gene_type:complete